MYKRIPVVVLADLGNGVQQFYILWVLFDSRARIGSRRSSIPRRLQFVLQQTLQQALGHWLHGRPLLVVV